MTSLMPLLRRGLLSGLLSGLAAGAFSYFLTEPIMDRAVALEAVRHAAEEARRAAAGLMPEKHVDVFSRATQHAGLIVAAIVVGLALGALFAVLYWVVYKHDADKAPWRQSLWLAAATFTAVWLLPFLRYPSNPPGVGSVATVSFRTYIWLASIAVSIVIIVGVWRLHGSLVMRGVSGPARQSAATGLLIAGLAILFLLPDNPDALDVPAGLLWDFRLLSLATTLLLWAVLGAFFGWLGERETHRRV